MPARKVVCAATYHSPQERAVIATKRFDESLQGLTISSVMPRPSLMYSAYSGASSLHAVADWIGLPFSRDGNLWLMVKLVQGLYAIALSIHFH
jgi:hypothetical protein